MSDVRRFFQEFQKSSRSRVRRVFGEPDFEGTDAVGADVMRYDLGIVPSEEEEGERSVSFIFKNGKVFSLLGYDTK